MGEGGNVVGVGWEGMSGFQEGRVSRAPGHRTPDKSLKGCFHWVFHHNLVAA